MPPGVPQGERDYETHSALPGMVGEVYPGIYALPSHPGRCTYPPCAPSLLGPHGTHVDGAGVNDSVERPTVGKRLLP